METRSILIEVSPKMDDAAFSIRRSTRRSMQFDLGIQVDPLFTPIPLRTSAGEPGFAFGAEMNFPRATVLLRADATEEEISGLLDRPGVVALWSDPEIAPFAIDCDSETAKGNSADIARAIGADEVWQLSGTRGDRINIGIVDGGVDAHKFPVIGGWSPNPFSSPGDSNVFWDEHGNMCAHDALIACPDASIFDYRIGATKPDNNIPALLSSAIQSFQHALDLLSQGRPYPQIMSNSWGLYKQSWDPYPPGHASNYTHNLEHPLIRVIMDYIGAGNLVTFAAGNCGNRCAPSFRCGADIGPGKSIRGANGHPRVISVGAVNLLDEWIGYSSQGPSTLAPEKPDLCGYSHFRGYFASDSGTSAACPVVAGVLGLLRAARGRFDQDRARAVLIASARKVAGNQWRNDFGYGIVDAAAAYRMLP
jgi:subtilisin family serine protease